MKKIFAGALTAALCASLVLSGCGSSENKQSAAKLDPNKPVSLTVWHYYNGAQQAAFDELISEFNSSVGKDEGIYVEGYTQGSVADLEKAVTDSINGVVGSQELPDIFSAYADTAYEVQKADKLADLTQYFSDDELSQYVDAYISEGYFNDDGALYLFPVAKSTEIMMMNATDWEPFAEETGSTVEELSTLEGVVDVAKRYYEWTDAETPDIPDDGKAFYGRDSMSNYFIIGMKQLGTDIFDVKNGSVSINVDKDKIRRLWDLYYVPYVNGYFAKFGKFCSDDVKTGDLLAYTGSSSSAVYFPDQVVLDNGEKPINYMVLPVPVIDGGEPVNVQQGAGMAVTKSDPQREYAASEFLKWFTDKENNLRFVAESSYLPVRRDANTIEALDEVIDKDKLNIDDKTYSCLTRIIGDFDSTEFYMPKPFENYYQTRKVLDYNLSDKAAEDKAAIDEAAAAGTPRAEAAAVYTSDEAFEEWYASFCDALDEAAYGAK